MTLHAQENQTLPVRLRPENTAWTPQDPDNNREVTCEIPLSDHNQERVRTFKIALNRKGKNISNPFFRQLTLEERNHPYWMARIARIEGTTVEIELKHPIDHEDYLFQVRSHPSHALHAYKAQLEQIRDHHLQALHLEKQSTQQAIDKLKADQQHHETSVKETEQHQQRLSEKLSTTQQKLQTQEKQLKTSQKHTEKLQKELQRWSTHLEQVKAQHHKLTAPLTHPGSGKTYGELHPFASEEEAVQRAFTALKQARGVNEEEFAVLHAALKTSSFTILTGPSGSGKTSLLKDYATAMGMRTHLIAVQPNWTGLEDIQGFEHPLGNRPYMETPFYRALRDQVTATQGIPEANEDRINPLHPVDLVVLDEINLSHVEYFLADYLSALETPERQVSLHPWKDPIQVPHSFLITGTANEDHTTRGFSDKFRDRSAILHIDPPHWDAQLLAQTQVAPQGYVPLSDWTPQGWLKTEPQPKFQQPFVELFKQLAKIKKELSLSVRVGRGTYMLAWHAHKTLLHLGLSSQEVKTTAADLALQCRVGQKLQAWRDHLLTDHDLKALKELFEKKGLTRTAGRLG